MTDVIAKPCPFCGETPTGHLLTDGGSKYGALACNCGVTGPDVRTDYTDWPVWSEKAIRAWNEQPAADALRAEIAELRKDSARWKWLEGSADPATWESIGCQAEMNRHLHVDAAMAKETGQ